MANNGPLRLREHGAVKAKVGIKFCNGRRTDGQCAVRAAAADIKIQHRHAHLAAEMIAHPGAKKEQGVGREGELLSFQDQTAFAL